MESKLVLLSLAGATLILLLWAGSGTLIYWCFPEPERHGTFGDMFGAVNALFSGLAFLGVIVAITLQRQELELQREEMREARIAQQASAGAQREHLVVASFHAKLEALNHIINGYERRLQRVEGSASPDERKESERLAREREKYEDLLKALIQDHFNAG